MQNHNRKSGKDVYKRQSQRDGIRKTSALASCSVASSLSIQPVISIFDAVNSRRRSPSPIQINFHSGNDSAIRLNIDGFFGKLILPKVQMTGCSLSNSFLPVSYTHLL